MELSRERRVWTVHRALALSWEIPMNGLIYLIGLIVVVMIVLSFLGLR
ncbi:MAG TPA: hypothetical protein VFQ89_08340 [Candidatus Binatia bacterium]|nr:hypothetical protein [Candidatus Binatia bacterium]